jgi:hypothetical protein
VFVEGVPTESTEAAILLGRPASRVAATLAAGADFGPGLADIAVTQQASE